ncbi:abortive infection family protein [Mesorhizobium ventifaucium]|uniref:Abortive infection protein-like C-terminal domain-containing protein n=1 Tax=Mesorhizobium ventifaucium TaxID=666020 RepID=A0ABM9EDA7_9HYPH|nr:abortive infection family protein [Mesorhizobium ventifaucium]CAH2407301.1 conserved hypothetical protein [Mesorhizobium ventifaucium]
MKLRITPEETRRLRQAVAHAISGFKAYDVPGLCTRLGLSEGDSDEAYRSKFTYASKRLAGVSAEQVIEVAKLILAEVEDFDLQEFVALITERGSPPVTELTRRRIASGLEGHPLCTEIDEIDLLRRVWPIGSMLSKFNDSRNWEDFGTHTLETDIIRHTVANSDWSQKDLLTALDFFTCSRDQVFRFLQSLVDPVVQTPDRQAEVVALLNKHLQPDGYALKVVRRLSGSPVYEVRAASIGAPADAAISAVLAEFDPDHVHQRWEMAMDRRSSDPAGAITLARTLLEDVCKWILSEASETFADDEELPALYRKLAKTLKIAPDDYTEKVFKQILGGCQSIVESLGALRNRLGDAHSQGPLRARPQARHAELAVNLSGSMATFLVSTWRERQRQSRAD